MAGVDPAGGWGGAAPEHAGQGSAGWHDAAGHPQQHPGGQPRPEWSGGPSHQPDGGFQQSGLAQAAAPVQPGHPGSPVQHGWSEPVPADRPVWTAEGGAQQGQWYQAASAADRPGGGNWAAPVNASWEQGQTTPYSGQQHHPQQYTTQQYAAEAYAAPPQHAGQHPAGPEYAAPQHAAPQYAGDAYAGQQHLTQQYPGQGHEGPPAAGWQGYPANPDGQPWQQPGNPPDSGQQQYAPRHGAGEQYPDPAAVAQSTGGTAQAGQAPTYQQAAWQPPQPAAWVPDQRHVDEQVNGGTGANG